MARTPPFSRAFTPAHGTPVPVADHVVRVTANNPSAFTFHGTNSYLVGNQNVAVIDPGPDDPAHLQALLAAIGDRPVTHIVVSHTHADHSPLARALKKATGAPIVGAAPHFAARPLHDGETNPLEEAADRDHAPDTVLADGQMVSGDGWMLQTIATPGHTANHLCFALADTGIVFTADHIMAWATTVVAPPDGAMADHMASLDRMLARDDRLYLPGHGGPVDQPAPFVRALKGHRRMRERAIIERVRQGDRTIAQMVAAIYTDTDRRLHGAAALSVLAHLEDLVGRGLLRCDDLVGLDSIFLPIDAPDGDTSQS